MTNKEKQEMTKAEVVGLMGSSKSEAEWAANCDVVKGNFREHVELTDFGEYPAYWFRAVIVSGLRAKTSRKWTEGKRGGAS